MERSSRDDNANKNSRNATNHGRDLSASQDVSDLSLSQTDESQLQTIISDLTAAFTSSRGLRSEYQLSPDGLKQLVKYSVNKPWEKIRYKLCELRLQA